MQIRNILIKNFRGIKELNWTILSPIVCLIGAGDSTKSTILDALEYALSPRWNLTFEDCDFYLGNTENAIEIVVTVGQIPEELLTHDKFGLSKRGWNPKDGIHDEPQNEDEEILSIRLKVDKSLEPEWTVVNDRDTEGKHISSKDREKLGTGRLGIFIDKHLYWGQGSALSNLTTDKKENATPAIIDAQRQARDAAKIDEINVFKNTVAQAEQIAKDMGFKPKDALRPALDPRAITIGLGAIAIHDGNIPLRLTGLGSRRLIALGVQLYCVEDGSLLLIDEIENSLEPHRIRHLLQYLQKAVNKDPKKAGQVIMTSHSPTVIVELPADNLYVVHSTNGNTSVQNVSKELQGTIRKVPESLLGLKVVVCEGKTELGICRSLEKYYWQDQKSKPSIAYQGAVLVEGEGSNHGSKIASHLASLGFSTCLFIDGDKIKSLEPSIDNLTKNGVKVLHWSKEVSTEQQVASDISWNGIKGMVELGVLHRSEESVYAVICQRLGKSLNEIGRELDSWRAIGIPEEEIRTAIGNASKQKDKEWFKTIDYGEELGKLIIQDLPNIADKETAKVLDGIEGWIYG